MLIGREYTVSLREKFQAEGEGKRFMKELEAGKFILVPT
jgi:hypothetical protein